MQVSKSLVGFIEPDSTREPPRILHFFHVLQPLFALMVLNFSVHVVFFVLRNVMHVHVDSVPRPLFVLMVLNFFLFIVFLVLCGVMHVVLGTFLLRVLVLRGVMRVVLGTFLLRDFS